MMQIQIDYASDDSCEIRLWAKGFHETKPFLVACEHALIAFDERRVSLAQESVSQAHWRTVQADAQTRDCGVCDVVHKPSKPGRGAYAVTILDKWLPLHLV